MSKPLVSRPPKVPRTRPLLEQALAAARRSAAHDVNNLLAVLRGNLQLLPMAAPEEARELLAEMDFACERLALASDGWQLADAQPAQQGLRCAIGEVVTKVVDLVQRATDSQVQVLASQRAMDGLCAVDERILRAALYHTLRTMARVGLGAPLEIQVSRVRQWLVLTVCTPCAPDRTPVVLTPAQSVCRSQPELPRLDVGLWDASVALRACGGELVVRHAAAVLRVRLRLPAVAPD